MVTSIVAASLGDGIVVIYLLVESTTVESYNYFNFISADHFMLG